MATLMTKSARPPQVNNQPDYLDQQLDLVGAGGIINYNLSARDHGGYSQYSGNDSRPASNYNLQMPKAAGIHENKDALMKRSANYRAGQAIIKQANFEADPAVSQSAVGSISPISKSYLRNIKNPRRSQGHIKVGWNGRN